MRRQAPPRRTLFSLTRHDHRLVRTFAASLGAALLLLLLPGTLLCAHAQEERTPPPPEQPPNVLWISLEDLSLRLGAYGDEVARTGSSTRSRSA